MACAVALSVAAPAVQAETKAPSLLKAKAEARLEKNSEIRNEKVGDLKDLRASSTIMMRNLNGEFKGMRASSTMMIRDIRASSTEMFKKFKDDRKEIMQKMHRDAFEIRKNALVKELNLSLENLTNIRSRINDRIVKLEAEGKIMTDAKASLVTADDKLAKAKIAVDLFASTNFASATASTTVDVSLDKPRKAGDEAIKAVKEARDSFKKVIEAIVDALGFGKGWDRATTTATTTSI